MTFHELDTISLTCDMPTLGLVAGQEGVIVHMHTATFVEVEFFTPAGDTLLVAPVSTERLRASLPPDRRGARPRH